MQNKPILIVHAALVLLFAFDCFFLSRTHEHSVTKSIPKQDRIDLAIQQEYRRTKDPKLNTVPVERLLIAAQVRDLHLVQRTTAAVPGINWTERGPSNVGGRSRVTWFDLGDAGNGYKKVWAGGVGGGLWYTNDITSASPSWNKVNDLFDNIAVTAFTQDPSSFNTMYFGTGEGWFNADAIKGLGIWKSTDGGASWIKLNSTSNFAYVQDLLIDQNGNLYAAVRPRVASDAYGIQKSTDGGATWTQVVGSPLAGFPSSRGCDLELGANGDIYASIGNFSEGRIYRSSFAANGANTGNPGTWTDITPNPNTNAIPAVGDNYNRIEIMTAPNDGDIVYAIFEGNGTYDVSHIKQYNASSNTWTDRTVPNYSGGGPYTRQQAWYDLIGTVDPNDAATLYIGGIDLYKSTNNGAAWIRVSDWRPVALPYIHADFHQLCYGPGSSSRLMIGCDGGVFYTSDANLATPSFSEKNSGYNVTQFYAVAIHPTNSDFFLAGAQDNGTQKFTSAGMNSTTEVTGGDGAFCHIDQDDGNIQITSYVYNQYWVSTNGGTSFSTRFKNTDGDFINPTDYDDAANILYGGSVAGEYFRWLDPATNGTDASIAIAQFSGAGVTHVMCSGLTANRVYFGLDNGTVVKVDNANGGGAAGTVIFNQSIGGSISCVAIDPTNENHLLVTFSNYGVNSVWETTNGGSSWTSVEGNLPDMPVRWVMFDPRNSDMALLATELGVWSTDNLDGGTTAWDPTNTGLANVRVDMLQYRSSDGVIAAATHGRGLFTAVVPASTTPDISFSVSSATVTESATVPNGCRPYTAYSVNMLISNAPTGDATVTVNVQGGATATAGDDYEFTTNGDFVSPSNTILFLDGQSSAKTIDIRVYDDAEVETPQQFTFDYSISGSTDAQPGSSNQTYTLTINDNDKAPAAASTGTYTLAPYDINSNATSPFQSGSRRARAQYLVTASELNAAGMTGPGNITQLAWNVVTKNSTAAFTGFTISMATTGASNLNSGFIATAFTQVYTANYTVAGPGWQTINFSTPFNWDGSSNILVQTCFDNGNGAPTPGNDVLQGNAAPFGSGNRATAIKTASGGSTAGCSLTGASVSDSRPMFRFSMELPETPVETDLSAAKSIYLGPNADVYYYSSGDGELLARIRNLSSHDYGCTNIEIDRAGTGSSQFWNTLPVNYLMDKTFRVIPTVNNAAGSYEITLYFTESEVQGWEAATGQSFSSIQLIKLPGQISSVTPADPEPDGPGTVQVVTPATGNLGTHYTITYTFNNGFSGFGAGIPGASGALPVELLTFTGELKNESINLNWSTSMEQDSRRFDIEKSIDGARFSRIGTVAAAGTSYTKKDYRFTDPGKPAAYNYYRLRMVDLDESFKYSEVVLVKNNSSKQDVFVYMNPFTDRLELQFTRIPGGKVAVSMFDMQGRRVLETAFEEYSQANLLLNTGNRHLSSGIYSLRVETDGKVYNLKVMKQ